MNRFIQICLVAMMVSLAGFAVTEAHEGHEHDAPKVVVAPKGGSIQPLEGGYVEVVSKGKDLKVFVYKKDLTPMATAKVQIRAKAILPRTKGPVGIKLSAMAGGFESHFDAKSAHRYTLVLNVSLGVLPTKRSKPAELKFTIEPRN